MDRALILKTAREILFKPTCNPERGCTCCTGDDVGMFEYLDGAIGELIDEQRQTNDKMRKDLGLAAMNIKSTRRRITGEYVNPSRNLSPLPPLDGALRAVERIQAAMGERV